MKRYLAILLVIALSLIAPTIVTGQIPNAGFENWTSDTLTGWWSNNVSPLYSTISKTTTVHGGSFAVRGDVVAFFSQTIQPALQSGVDARGFAYSQRPFSITGYYEFFPAATSGDRFGVNVVLYKGGTNGIQVGVAASAPSTAVSSYTQFSAVFNYLTADVPDTCVVQFQIIGPSAQVSPTVGSYFLLDDIALTGISGVDDRNAAVPALFKLDQNYPNPFNPRTNIAFSVHFEGRAILTVYTLLGQEVSSLFDGRVSPGRTYRMAFDGSALPSGIYFSRLKFIPAGTNAGGTQVLMRKMTLLK